MYHCPCFWGYAFLWGYFTSKKTSFCCVWAHFSRGFRFGCLVMGALTARKTSVFILRVEPIAKLFAILRELCGYGFSWGAAFGITRVEWLIEWMFVGWHNDTTSWFVLLLRYCLFGQSMCSHHSYRVHVLALLLHLGQGLGSHFVVLQ
jgi:hypothetical protein